jgi:hypothetical protein
MNTVILLDYSSEIRVLPGKITNINARINDIDISDLQDRLTTFEP